MLCENCKELPATVVFKQETMNGTTERHLCDKCAFYSQTFSFSPDQEPLSIQQFLAHWLGGSELLQGQKSNETLPDGPKCPSCGLTFHRFLDIGKFGCATCYDTFREQLPRVFAKLHNGNTNHGGKVPVSFNERFALKKQLEDIRTKMKEAVEAERFEEAAILRDEANTVKQQLADGGDDQHVI
ncbi:UvrB/UvrC motif-containing protein [Sporosarcina newyorkensis]|uniref:Protein-arginine kinase activator protein McsA n=1 Tax=Sporosarcina newyorkensis TaxID=759851 RepID=A0A1T4YVP6_9BACL|nr:UvrB/UvrC motif-containing protein [Sporosarcina newyorkensis]SKB05849.1 Protein-arginine kinase activator protein McsA [Sporosarcina newyorkensis]